MDIISHHLVYIRNLPWCRTLDTQHYICIIAEGDSNKFFEVPHTNAPQVPPTGENTGKDQGAILDFQCMGDLQEDTTVVLAQALFVNDDNKLAPKNIPTMKLGSICLLTGLLQDQCWNWRICRLSWAGPNIWQTW